MKVFHIQPGAFYDGWTYQENLLTKWQHKNGHDVTVITTRWSVDAQGNIGLVPEDRHADFSNSGRKWSLKFQAKRILGRTSIASRRLIPYVKKFYGVLPARVDYLQYVYKIPAEKCELLLMGADDDLVAEAKQPEVRKELRTKYNIAPDDFLVMTGGKIDTAKTQTLFLMEAVRNIASPKVKLIVFGPVVPELKVRFDSLIDGKTVQYVSYVEGRETCKYFASSDLVVFPGRHSVFWEQVTGLGIPMLCKKWAGTTHVDLGGNVRFLTHDSTSEIQGEIQRLVASPEEYRHMKSVAEQEGIKVFSYRRIARQSLEE